MHQCWLLSNGREDGSLGTERRDKYETSQLSRVHLSLSGHDEEVRGNMVGAQATYTLSSQMMFHITLLLPRKSRRIFPISELVTEKFLF